MGGVVPLGYDVEEKKLVRNAAEAETVRTLFRLYLEQGNVRHVQQATDRLGLRTKAGRPDNGNEAVRDEVVELLRPRGGVLMACRLGVGESVVEAAPVGDLEPKQRITFELVREHGETDAGELMRGYGAREGLKHATAWNNRLAALAALGLVVELRVASQNVIRVWMGLADTVRKRDPVAHDMASMANGDQATVSRALGPRDGVFCSSSPNSLAADVGNAAPVFPTVGSYSMGFPVTLLARLARQSTHYPTRDS